MPHHIIATQTRTIFEADGVTPIINLFEDQEVEINNDELKEALLLWGWAKPYDITKPYPPRGVNVYENGMVYNGNRLVIYGTGLYQSKLTLLNNSTSNTWVESEWNLILQGV